MAMQEKESQSERPVGISTTTVIVAIVALVLVGMSAVTYLVVVNREADQVVALISLILAPTIIGLFNLIRGDRQGSAIDTVRRQTNGAFEKMSQRVEMLEDAYFNDSEPEPGWTRRPDLEPDPRTPINPPTRWDFQVPQDYEFGAGQYPSPAPWQPEDDRPYVQAPPRRPPRPPQNRPTGAHRRPGPQR